MKWTKKQEEAISLRGRNLLVSAAAGSGKTAVLVERIKRLILEDGVSVDRFLVVTFTKAAASEMKEKIIKALYDEIGQGEGDSKVINFLREQTEKIYHSNISTFHSFAMEIIRNYFHVVGIDPDVRVCDETEAQLMKNDSLDETFRLFFKEGNKNFHRLLLAYGSEKNENDLKEGILDLYERVQSMPEALDWLCEKVDFIKTEPEKFQQGPMMKFIFTDVSSKVKESLSYLQEACRILMESGLERLSSKVAEDKSYLADVAQRAAEESSNFTKIGDELKEYTASKLVAKKEEKEEYEPVKEEVSRLRKQARSIVSELCQKYFSDSLENQMKLIEATRPYMETVIKILKKFKEIYGKKKEEKNLIDYNDMEHLAIEILKDSEVAKEYRDKFQYIFIDEYQDSNYLQEAMIAAISRKDNLFMVGDIKQSIYRFRLAEPAIFKERYKGYKDGIDDGVKIDLNENFRSKKPIIDSINRLFENIMDDYDEDAALYEGNPREEDIHYPVEMHVVDSSKELEEEGEVDEELIDMSRAQLEALTAAKIIKKSLGKSIFDHKTGEERPLQKKDMVILMRTVRNRAEIFSKVLSSQGIPVYLDDNTGYFDTLEIRTLLDLLRVIDNKQQDIPLLSVLRSPVFDFSIEDLIKIRLKSRDTSFFEAMEQYADHGEDERLGKEIKRIFEKLALWKREASYTPLHVFVWKLMTVTRYYAFAGMINGGEKRQGNLRAFVDKTLAFERKGNGTIFGLLRYIETIGRRKIDVGQASLLGEKEDLIRIMTIHKSKGLEYPMVILCGLGQKFTAEKKRATGTIHGKLGFAMTYVNASEKWKKRNLAEEVIGEANSKEALEEEIRILYVAVTRAKDKLFLVGSTSDGKKYRKNMESDMLGKGNYMDIIAPYLKDAEIFTKFHSREDLGNYLSEDKKEKPNLFSELEDYEKNRDPDLKKRIGDILEYEYPYKKELGMPSKFSVTELNRSDKKKLTLNIPLFAAGKTKLSGAEIGTLYHTAMEHLDFKAAYEKITASGDERGEEYIQSVIGDLTNREILTPEEAGYLSSKKISNFFKSDIGRRAASADVLYKEKSFNILTRHRGAEVMVQGIIDCYFEEEGELILLDYKTNYSSEGIGERYREQMALYGEALGKTEGRCPTEIHLYLFSENRGIRIV